MCGISGYFSTRPINRKGESEKIKSMTAALAHRGPDGSGVEFFDHAVLSHNRLAIIDPEGGAQPFIGQRGTCISFNGEIYNFRELRSHLKHYPFRTQSDTEVIVALYETEGVSGFNRLRGMFAFALWDKRCGYLVRDPMGIKPLFFSEVGSKLLFASEAKSIIAYTGHSEINEHALHMLLNFRYVTGESSLFSGIEQIPPGGILIWELGKLSQCRLTSVEKVKLPIYEAISNAVSSHLVSDVPLGCYLSGGIDSALVAKIASTQIPLTSFTLEVGDDPLEADHAEVTANWLGIPNYRHPFHLEDPVGFHRNLVYHLETPKVNAVQGAILAAFTAQRVKVALSGLGGDEIFYGYNAHQILWLMQRIQQGWLSGFCCKLLTLTLHPFIKNKEWTEPHRIMEMLKTSPDWSRVYGILRNVWDAPGLRHAIYGERMLDSHPPCAFEWLRNRFPNEPDAVAAAATFELKNKLINDLLWQEDRVSMRSGLEVRVPFLDQELVGTARSKSRKEIMPWGNKKYLLKRYAQNELPKELIQRPKSGFQLDIIAAAQGLLKPLFDEYLSDERIHHHRFFNPSFVHTVKSQLPHKGLRWHYFLLYLMAQTHMLVEEFHAD